MKPRTSRKSLSLLLAGTALLFFTACGDKKPAPQDEGLHMKSTNLGHEDHHEGGHEDHGVMAGDSHKIMKKAEIKVNETGYVPAMVMAKAGEPITLVFTRTTDKGCGQEVLIPSEGIKKALPLGVPVEITFTPKESGNLEFTCGMKMMKGTIMVH